MLHSSDLVFLPYTDDLTETGILYALRSLAFTYDRMGGTRIERLRRIACGKSVEKAFQVYLQAQGTHYDDRGSTPFTDPDRYDLAIDGRRCDLKSFQFFDRQRAEKLQADPEFIFEATALVPDDQLNAARHDDDDLYLFAFSTAKVHAQPVRESIRSGQGQRFDLIHPLPGSWARTGNRQSLGRILLTVGAGRNIRVEIGGCGSRGQFQTEIVTLSAGRRTAAKRNFYSLAYLRTDALQAGRIGIYSSALGQTYSAGLQDWDNIWINGGQIVLVGWISHGEFRRRATRIPTGSRVLQYPHTRTENWGLPMRELYPIEVLLQHETVG